MNLKRKLNNWQQAGLITPAQCKSITSYETKNSKNSLITGLFYVALLSICLGLILIVGANWQKIPDYTKLASHFFVNILLTTLVYRWKNVPNRYFACQAALFLLWGLTLTLIALIGQIFQLSSDGYTGARLWFLISSPMILLLATSRFISVLWSLFFVIFIPLDFYTNIIQHLAPPYRSPYYIVAYALAPALLFLMANTPSFAQTRPNFAASFTSLARLSALTAATLSSLFFYDTDPLNLSPTAIGSLLATLSVMLLLMFIRHSIPRKSAKKPALDLFILCAFFIGLPFIIPQHTPLIALAHCLLLWLGAAVIFQRNQNINLLNFSIIIITLRLFIGFLELFGSMMTSGLGFVLMGILLLILLSLANAIRKRLT